MSIAAYLVCPSREMSIFLGKRLRHRDGPIFGFSVGPAMAEEDPEHCAALFAFLADTAGEQLRVALSYEDDFEVVAGYRMVGGDAEDGDIPFADYLR
jgi:hypothetical protein